MTVFRMAFLLCVVFPLFSIVGSAQQSYRDESPVMDPSLPNWQYGDQPSWGVFGSVNITDHRMDAAALPGGLMFESGSGITSSIGVLGDVPLYRRYLALQLRVGYHNYNHRPMTDVRNIVGKPVGGGYEETEGSIRRVSGVRLSSLAIEPLLRFRPTHHLSLMAGGHAGFVLNASYERREEVISPENGVFMDTRTRARVLFSGDLPDAASLEVALVGGISYSLPMNRRHSWFFVPEILYTIGLTDIARDTPWSVNSVRFGVSFVSL